MPATSARLNRLSDAANDLDIGSQRRHLVCLITPFLIPSGFLALSIDRLNTGYT
jgi:hypothetical protein